MFDVVGDSLDALVESWEEIRLCYQDSANAEYDLAVLDCVAKLAEEPGGEQAWLWVLGSVITAPYLTWLPGDGVADAAVKALRAADAALRAQPCTHVSHPYETHTDEDDEILLDVFSPLANEGEEWEGWEEPRPREEWLCPRNVAGFARIALDILDPGSVADVPARLPAEAVEQIDVLSCLLEGYPKWSTDVEDEIASQGWALSTADPEELAGRVLVVRAVSWHAIWDTERKSVLDDLIEGLEKALARYDRVSCEHDPDDHPRLPNSGPIAAEQGILLSYAAGRARYERSPRGREEPLEALLCPAFIAAVAQESLDSLIKCRDQRFGAGDASQSNVDS
ncbi:hypothetical protein [Saccharopolyspora shandongensis]|nr:hypothetical protein [Saccharopolyspora shandongensis]